jgi:hypothetical protein
LADDGTSIPLGSEVDVTNGTVRLVSRTVSGGTQAANFFGGRFVVTQTAGGLIELRLSGGDFRKLCPAGKTRATSAVGKRAPTVVRKLWGNGKGRFRTRGRYASAAVRGTFWLTADRCDDTFVRVRVGSVLVVDFPKRRQRIVAAGNTYTATKP